MPWVTMPSCRVQADFQPMVLWHQAQTRAIRAAVSVGSRVDTGIRPIFKSTITH